MNPPVSAGPALSPLDALDAELRRYSDMVIAFSGGVDSALLLAAAHRRLGSAVLAVTADSPSIAREELAGASALAASLGVRHTVIKTGELRRSGLRDEQPLTLLCMQTDSV